MKLKKKMLSGMVAFSLAIGSAVPITALAAETGNKSIQLGTGSISGWDNDKGYDYIYYGTWDNEPIKWRVLDDETNTGEKGLFLLTEKLYGTGANGNVNFDNTSPYNNSWQDSSAQEWCEEFLEASFTETESKAVMATAKSDSEYTSTNYTFSASENILNGDKIFFLSAEEAETEKYGFTDEASQIADYGSSAGYWWTRSPFNYNDFIAGLVYDSGDMGTDYVGGSWAVRPAFNLNSESVLFISSAEGGKAGISVNEIGTTDSDEWKLTLLDSERSFSVNETEAVGQTGDIITLNYTGAETGENEYISIIITDGDNALYYGRIQDINEENGTAYFRIPDGLAAGTYTVNVFNEQYNGGDDDNSKCTDYASEFSKITLTVIDEQEVEKTTEAEKPSAFLMVLMRQIQIMMS